MTPAIIYAAKSTEDKRGSIPTQLEDCRAAAGAEGREIVAEYQDEAASALKGDRGPGLKAALEHAERLAETRGAAELWVQHPDRLARGDGLQAMHLIEYVMRTRKAHVQLRAVQHDDSFKDLIRAVLTGERNHEDSERKSESVKAGMKRRKAKGLHSGGPRKYGYEYVRDDYGRTVPDEPHRTVAAEAAIVERIYREYVAGVSQNTIQRTLNGEGVPTTRGKSWHQGPSPRCLAIRGSPASCRAIMAS
jgi:site-specific DNA recombinase